MKVNSPWISDSGNGQYRNPVLFADYSDPDVIRVGDTYYMTASSFNCTPGLPVLTSGDMVNWTLIGHGIRNVPHPRYSEVQPGCGVWAPSIRYYNGLFYIVFPTPDEGLYVIHSMNPEEGWSEPHLLLAGKGLIDPCPFWDEDGKAYIVHGYAMSRSGIKSRLTLIEVTPDLKSVLGEGRYVVDAMGRLPTLEGPKMFKRGQYYYISAPAGGVPGGWQMVFRSESPWGPYEEKILLAQRGSTTNGPHQGSLLDDIEGNWWFVHFQEYQPWGRIVHLQPARWEDDWPLMGVDQDERGVGRPVQEFRKPASPADARTIPEAPADSDDFSDRVLGLQWQWNANHSSDWYDLTRGELTLFGGEIKDGPFYLYPRILTQKLNAPAFRAFVKFGFEPGGEDEEAGICIVGMVSARVGLKRVDGQLSLICREDDQILFSEPVDSTEQSLFVEVNEGGICRFGAETDGSSAYLGPGFRSVEGRWIGARFGLYCLGGNGTNVSARFSSVRINEWSEKV